MASFCFVFPWGREDIVVTFWYKHFSRRMQPQIFKRWATVMLVSSQQSHCIIPVRYVREYNCQSLANLRESHSPNNMWFMFAMWHYGEECVRVFSYMFSSWASHACRAQHSACLTGKINKSHPPGMDGKYPKCHLMGQRSVLLAEQDQIAREREKRKNEGE